jgi:PIN domain nuclease of toxin-antitoxin system
MRVLLDTHVLIWWDAGQHLSAAAKRTIQAADDVYVSAASAWEIAIKLALGKISTVRSVNIAVEECGFQELPITFAHADRLQLLPAVHRDPFDRLIIAQALVEDCVVITRDTMFAAYGVHTIKA